ncbi:endonuclease/exonuclease/phosphatase family protein [Akkermansiaceae bacterium]|nr:endonuclease/exonuclease/phosphatase family protein [Akkermansiaceae bacterium]
MKWLGVLVAMWFCSGCEKARVPRAVAVSEDGAMELRLMTVNLRYENDGDRGRRAWAQRVIGMVGMIRTNAPDVFGIQEGLHGQVADLRASLPGYGFEGLGRSDGKRAGEYAGIFFRSDRFEQDVGRSGMIWLSATPEKAGSMTWGNEIPRVATWVRLTDRASGQPLWVVNMHLDHRNQPSREKGVRLMAERLVEMNPDGEPVVWMGDFNAVEGNPALAFLSGKASHIPAVEGFDGLVETYDALNAGERERGTLHFWMSDPNRQWKVDHILISRGGEVLESGILRTGEPYLSDHFPVTARVRFPAFGK